MPSIALPVAADHPAFAGHFPERPIVPGVVLLDLTLLALESATGLNIQALGVAKFLSPALPGELLWLDYQIDGATLRFDIRCETRKVATGRFLTHPSPAP